MSLPEFCALVFSLALGFGGTAWFTRRYGWTRPNFRGARIPSLFGLAFVLAGECFYAFEWLQRGGQDPWVPAAYFLATLGFGLLGLLDDLAGDRQTGGFRGHFRALARGQITTGAVKALGGGVVALLAGYLLTDDPIFWHHPGLWWRWPLAGLLIALSANVLNLLDVRPGRGLAGFFIGALIVFAVLWHQHAVGIGFLFWFAVAVAVILYPLDAGGHVMLGDTGANAFGAVWGVAAVLYFSPLWQAVIVALWLAFHVWSEHHSLSQTIERSPWLRRLDRKIGIR
jgi:UDP-GlcNAc:undecaprenyl-phosphate GlcNAc-1-phosphate transferase